MERKKPKRNETERNERGDGDGDGGNLLHITGVDTLSFKRGSYNKTSNLSTCHTQQKRTNVTMNYAESNYSAFTENYFSLCSNAI